MSTGESLLKGVIGSWSSASSEPTGYCPGPGCTEQVPERVLVCRGCVVLVPDELLDAYYATFRRGQDAASQAAANKAAYAAILDFCSQLVTA